MKTSTLKVDEHEKTSTAVLAVDERNVAWLSFSIKNGQVFLHSIETRPEYRNLGYSKDLLNRVASRYQVEQVVHMGGFTPEGFAYVFPNVTRPDSAGVADANYDPMDFICDWETMAKHTRFCGHDDE